MEMHQIRYFLAVYETTNFTRAAALCNVAQPSLTQAIKKLEDEFGGQLFYREKKTTRPTALANLIFPYFTKISEDSSQVLNTAQHFLKLEKVPLRIGFLKSIAPYPWTLFFSQLKKSKPGIEVELVFKSHDELTNLLRKEELDAFVSCTEEKLEEEIQEKFLYKEPYVVLFANNHHFFDYEKIALSDLSGELYIDRLSCELRDMVVSLCSQNDVNLYATFRIEREDWIHAMVENNCGIALMPKYSVKLSPQITCRPLVRPSVSRNLQVYTLGRQKNMPLIQTLLEKIGQWKLPF